MDNNVKLCRDCRHFVGQTCRHPSNLVPDYVNGGKTSVHTPEFLRTQMMCGRAAEWFQAREKAPA